MAKRWTLKEDVFLLSYCGVVGADFIATHDLGRPHGAGSRRLKKLMESGAASAFWRAEIAQIEFKKARGQDFFDYEGELAVALSNLADCEQ